ncbi:MAG TPA: OmpA family protein [Stellaceae bacterium]
MRPIIAATAAIILAATFSATARAADWSGPELGIQGGYGWGSSQGQVVPGFPAYSLSPDGGMGGGHAGYNFQFGPYVFGVEGDAEGGDISATRAGLGGSIRTQMDFDASIRGKMGFSFERVLAYGTGGVAFGLVDTTYKNAGGATVAAPSEIRVGWTAGGGLAYALTPNWNAGVEYRYTDLGSQRVAVGIESDRNRVTYNMIRLAATYRFAPPPPPPPPMVEPAPMPVAAPAMAPPMPTRAFLVFFDFDRYSLTPDARRVIEAAAASYKANGVARIDVAGYTDLAGTQAYNLRLSQRRADSVSAYLVAQGVPPGVLDVKWFGKEHPRVPTPDGVREPQNRRVEIMMP